jgi:dienelactone hydrolase
MTRTVRALSFLVVAGAALRAQSSPPDPATIALFAYDASAPLDVRIASTGQRDGFRILDLSYASPKGGRVPAYLYVPDTPGPHAGMLLMHGMPGSRSGGSRLATQLVLSGAVVLAPSAPWARPDGPRNNPVLFTEQDRTDQIQLMIDLRRGVDLLLAHEGVDSERLGYAGVSYGGAMGGLLAGLEHRIQAYVLVVGDGGLVSHFTGPDDDPGPLERLPREQREAWLAAMTPIEPIRFVGSAAPAHLLFQSGLGDRLVPEQDAEAYYQAASQPKTQIWYAGGHALTQERVADLVDWLAVRIGLVPPP